MSIAIGIVIGGLLAVGIMTILTVFLSDKPAPRVPDLPPRRTRETELRERFASCVAFGRTAVYLEPGHSRAEVPDRFRDMAVVRFDFSYRLSPGDLLFSEEGIRQTLSFSGIGAYRVFIPWASVLSVSPAPADSPPVGTRLFHLVPGGKGELN